MKLDITVLTSSPGHPDDSSGRPPSCHVIKLIPICRYMIKRTIKYMQISTCTVSDGCTENLYLLHRSGAVEINQGRGSGGGSWAAKSSPGEEWAQGDVGREKMEKWEKKIRSKKSYLVCCHHAAMFHCWFDSGAISEHSCWCKFIPLPGDNLTFININNTITASFFMTLHLSLQRFPLRYIPNT